MQQLFVRADADECAVVQNENFICLPDSGDALRYEKCGYAVAETANRLA